MSAERHFDDNDFLPVNFYFDTAIHTVVLPDSIKALRQGAINGCLFLVSVTGNFLEEIGYSIFYRTALEKAELSSRRTCHDSNP